MTPYQQAAFDAQSALKEVEAARQVLRDKQHKYFRLSERASSLFEAEHQVFLANLPNLGQAVKQRIDQRRAEISGTR